MSVQIKIMIKNNSTDGEVAEIERGTDTKFFLRAGREVEGEVDITNPVIIRIPELQAEQRGAL